MGNVSWSADLMGTSQVEESVAAEALEQRAVKLTLDCPDAVELDPGSSFECDAATPKGETDTVDVTIEDKEGNVTWAFPDRSNEPDTKDASATG